MKADRYVVGFAGKDRDVYGFGPDREINWASSVRSLGAAEKLARVAECEGEEIIIYRLVPVRRVKAKRKA